jgi:hypothetical protein
MGAMDFCGSRVCHSLSALLDDSMGVYSEILECPLFFLFSPRVQETGFQCRAKLKPILSRYLIKMGDPPGGRPGGSGVRHGVDEAPVSDAGSTIQSVFERTKTPRI